MISNFIKNYLLVINYLINIIWFFSFEDFVFYKILYYNFHNNIWSTNHNILKLFLIDNNITFRYAIIYEYNKKPKISNF